MSERIVYQPAFQQETINPIQPSWEILLGLPAIQENHNTPKRTSFAFDLGREYRHAQFFGSNYRDFFVTQAHFYARESYGRSRQVRYEHDIRTDHEGNPYLFINDLNTPARESYKEPIYDESLPDWLRKRAVQEYLAITSLEKQLITAQPGDIFVDISPTAFEIPMEERKKWSYGYHSFLRVHQVVVEEGKRKLVSRALRNYLDLPAQVELLKRLTDKTVSGTNILGTVAKLRQEFNGISIEGQDIAILQKIAEDLYGETPLERRIVPPPENQVFHDDKHVENILSIYEGWLVRIFSLMTTGEDPVVIQMEFQGWEMAVKEGLAGTSDLRQDSQHFANLLNDTTNDHQEPSSLERMRYFMNKPYDPGLNGCGIGSGFSNKLVERVSLDANVGVRSMEAGAGGRVSAKMDYKTLTYNEKKNTLECVNCPNCKNLVDGQIDGGRLTCPKCNHSVPYTPS